MIAGNFPGNNSQTKTSEESLFYKKEFANFQTQWNLYYTWDMKLLLARLLQDEECTVTTDGTNLYENVA